jgi:hypothetical protein
MVVDVRKPDIHRIYITRCAGFSGRQAVEVERWASERAVDPHRDGVAEHLADDAV